MLAIAGGKGGCGKTTTALGLARALAETGRRPLVVDADCDMPNVHTMAETARSPGLGALAEGASVERARHRSDAFPAVDVVPAGSATGAVDGRTLRRLERKPGPVIVDCAAGATDAVAAPLRVADGALVVSTTAPASLSDATKTARMAQALDTDVHGAVLTRTTGDSPARLPACAPLRGECPVLATVPEVTANPGSVLREPVGRAAYERLANSLGERNI